MNLYRGGGGNEVSEDSIKSIRLDSCFRSSEIMFDIP